MRVRKPVLLCAFLLSLGIGGAVIMCSTPDRSSAFSFGVLTYTNKGAFIDALVVVSNKSSAIVTFETWNFAEPPVKIFAQTATGWTSYEPKYETFEAIAVRPRERRVFTVRLPPGTLRWQISGLLQAATPKRRVMLGLMRLSPIRVSNWLLKRLPPDIRVRGGTFEVPAVVSTDAPPHNFFAPSDAEGNYAEYLDIIGETLLVEARFTSEQVAKIESSIDEIAECGRELEEHGASSRPERACRAAFVPSTRSPPHRPPCWWIRHPPQNHRSRSPPQRPSVAATKG